MKRIIVAAVLMLCLLTLAVAPFAMAEEAATAVESAAEDAAETVTEAAQDAAETVTEAAQDTAETVTEEAAAAADGAAEAAGEVAETAEEAAEEAVEEAEEVSEGWFKQAFGKIFEEPWYSISFILLLLVVGCFVYFQKSHTWTVMRAVLLAAVFALGLVLAIISTIRALGESVGVFPYILAILVLLVVMVVVLMTQDKKAWNARSVAYAAMCIATAYILSLIKLFEMPQGGSVKLAAMLPLVLYAMAFGAPKGLVAGCAFGLFKLINDPYIIHPVQLLVDYPMAYGAVALCCLAGLIKVDDRWKLLIAVVLGYLGKYIMSVLSGVIFFAEYAGDQNPLIYSLVYNITYIIPEAAIACVITLIPGFARILKAMKASAKA